MSNELRCFREMRIANDKAKLKSAVKKALKEPSEGRMNTILREALKKVENNE